MTPELIVTAADTCQRRLPVGAEPRSGHGTHFRVWAPSHSIVHVVLDDERRVERSTHPLRRDSDGYHAGHVASASAGDRYRFRLGDHAQLLPDPASRFQPDGPHGASQIVDPAAYEWRDDGWTGVPLARAVVYEMHIGTFTPEGTWAAAGTQLAALQEVGVTVLEVMPVGDFPGRFGWGYDGVSLFSPTRLYGSCDDMRRFVDRAHELGLAVILDVVYNHLGPDGNYLREFTPAYFSTRHRTEWGDALNFDGERSTGARELILANVACWISEYHLDGFRLDATQSIFDDSPRHILADIAARARDAAPGRTILLFAENEPQDVRTLRSIEEGGFGFDAVWNDDFHHTAVVALTGRTEAYYVDYGGTPQELVSAARHSFLYQGQHYAWQGKRRGTSTAGFAPSRFVHFLENHDQVANSADGRRLHQLTSAGQWRALTALLLLGPQTPMLFQGQEFAASSAFLYFADHHRQLAEDVWKGRREFLSQFPSLARPHVAALLPKPHDASTFERSKLDPRERERHAAAVLLHADLLRLRREEAAIRAATTRGVDGAVLGESAFVIRYAGSAAQEERLLIVNLGAVLHLVPAPQPLLAPPAGHRWTMHWSSEWARYGGPDRDAERAFAETGRVAAESALLLAPTDAAATD